MIMLNTPRDALIWLAIDRIFDGADACTVVAELEIDLQREQAERMLSRQDRLVSLLRETDPSQVDGVTAR
jgi:hypothetical protein